MSLPHPPVAPFYHLNTSFGLHSFHSWFLTSRNSGHLQINHALELTDSSTLFHKNYYRKKQLWYEKFKYIIRSILNSVLSFSYPQCIKSVKRNIYTYIPEVSLGTVTPITLCKPGKREINQVSGKTPAWEIFSETFQLHRNTVIIKPNFIRLRRYRWDIRFSWNTVHCMTIRRRV